MKTLAVGSKTGRYRVNPCTGELEKISPDGYIPSVAFDSVTCPTSGYLSENLGHNPVFVRSRRHKRDLLKSSNMREAGDG